MMMVSLRRMQTRCFLFLILPCISNAFLESRQWGHQPKNILPKDKLRLSSSIDFVEQLTGPFQPRQLQGYWGRQPVLIRQAFDIDSLQRIWPSWSDTVDMAITSEEEVEEGDGYDDEDTLVSCRLIQHVPGQLDSFDLQLGPWDESKWNFLTSSSNDKKWTLVVNDVDRCVPALADWMDDEFKFLPRWRRDDAQLSLANMQGGIGPHTDSYDVFLIQAAGERTWKVGHDTLTVAQEMDALIPELSVRILQDSAIQETSSFTLQAGDMLYIPPRFMHCGTAASDGCMTLSVGCRAPSAAELLARVAQAGAESVKASAVQRYTDTHPDELVVNTSVRSGPSLTVRVKDSMKKLVRDAVQDLLDDDLEWDSLVGKLTTEPNRFSDAAVVPYDEVEDPEFLQYWGETAGKAVQCVIDGQGVLRRSEGVSFATSSVQDNNGGTTINRLFASGEMFEIKDATAAAFFERIERGQSLKQDELVGASDQLLELLESLVSEGFLYPDDKDES